MNRMLGVMIDCSRNAVMKPEVVKEYAALIKKMGYNTLLLYTEDTYEIPQRPYFGHLRGKYTKEELKDIDSYCNEIGIELVACIQTLAHLENMFRWTDEFDSINDCDDILLCDDENTYALIDDMLKTVSECFTSTRVHIGMDEAVRVGLGKYLKNHKFGDRFDIINRHLHRVCEIAEKYNIEPMIWSDMFCQLALGVDNQYDEADCEKILEKAKLPKNISLVYWDYYSEDVEHYKKMIQTNKMFDRPVYFAGGAWTWAGFAPDNGFSVNATKAALSVCNQEGVDGIFITLWGDNGSECSKFAVLPTLLYAAETAHGNTDINTIKEKFYAITGYNFDDFMQLDKLSIKNERHSRFSSKYLLYNDIFLGIRDAICKNEDNLYYEKLAKKISEVSKAGKYEYMFKTYEKLSEVLSIKAALGANIHAAYKKGDTDELKRLVYECEKLENLLKEFHTLHQKRWFAENKPHGFDVQDIRIGGLLLRIASCKNRLAEYIKNPAVSIPELDEPILTKDAGKYKWNLIASVNNI